MTIPNSRGSYGDCYEIMDKALEAEWGVRVKLTTEAQATFFRMRCHQARAIHRRDNAVAYEPGHPMHNASPYDKLILRINRVEGEWYLYFDHLTLEALGEIEPLGHPRERQKVEAEDIAAAPQEWDADRLLVAEPVRRRV